jgi:two-component system, OmpR family, response regulator
MRAEVLRILVVDDDAPVRMTVTELLRRTGYEVVAAEDGVTALALLAHEPVDLVLLDLLMPGLCGWELALQIRQLHPSVAVVAFSGTSLDAVDQARWNALGIDYVSKTAAPREVLKHVAAALAGQLIPA